MTWRPTRTKNLDGAPDGFMPADTAGRGLSRTRYPYGSATQEGLESNVVMAPIHWITRNFTEAKAEVQKDADGVWETRRGHELASLLRHPNPYYSGNMLFKPTLLSMLLDGNGYWRKLRNMYGKVVELWYLPHFLTEPKWPTYGSEFISHYEYRPFATGLPVEIAPRDIVHFRFGGLDPENTRKGLSPVRPLLREVFTDEEASNFAASILRNMGVPGGVIAPKDVAAAQALKPEDAVAMKEYMRTAFTGDKRGEWMALGTPVQVEQFGFDPNQLMLGNLRDIAEERVCAMLGIPAAVVGFGAGLQQTKVGATMRELLQSAWDNCIIPLQNDVADQAGDQLLPDFEARWKRFQINFDRSGARVFEEDRGETAKRVEILVRAGVITVADGQAMTGKPVDERMRFYLLPAGTVAFDGEKRVEALAAPAPTPPPSGDEPPPVIAGEKNDDSPNQELPDA